MINREVIQNINKHTEDIKNLGSSLDNMATIVDDVNELENIVNQVLINKTGKILLKNKDYILTKPINIKEFVELNDFSMLEIVGGYKTTITPTFEGSLFTFGSDELLSQGNAYVGNVKLKMKDITFKSANKKCTGLDLKAIRQIDFENLEFRGFKQGICFNGQWGLSRVRRCSFYNCENGILFKLANNIELFSNGFFSCNRAINIESETPLENYTHNYQNNDIEGCDYGIYLNNQKGIRNFNLTNNHFEGNIIADLYFQNATSGFTNTSLNGLEINIQSLVVENNNFWKTNGIVIGTSVTGGRLHAVKFTNNMVYPKEGVTEVVKIGTECPLKCSNVISSNNAYVDESKSGYIATNIEKFIQAPFSSNFNEVNSLSDVMPRYQKNPVTPTGNSDVRGIIGDLRFDNSYAYLKTDTGWKYFELGSLSSYPPINKTGIANISATDVPPVTSNVGKVVQIPISGVNVDSNLIITLTPSTYFPSTITYSYAPYDGGVFVTFKNANTTQVTLPAFKMYYKIEKI